MHHHFKLFKPYGFLSQFQTNANHERNKQFLGKLHEFPKGTMAIGRLDKDSEGLLLLTTDGKVSYAICNSGVEKEYHVLVDGVPSEASLLQLEQGVRLSHKGESYTTKAYKVQLLKTPPNFPERVKNIRDERHGKSTWIAITITEGKFRQVRKMTAKVGLPTLRLVRVRVGTETLEGLGMGDVVQLKHAPAL